MNGLTVVVVPLQGSEKLRRCLNALASQRIDQKIETIVPYDDTLKDVKKLRAEFPHVTFLAIPGRQTYASLRSRGGRLASGQILAITEDHCIPRDDWAAKILRAHESSHAAVGGAVEKARPDSRLNWALYLIDYLRYSTPGEGPSQNLTDCNVSYKRTALAEIADVWKDEFHEPEVNGALHARGMSLWLSPEIVVYQQRSIGFNEALHDRYRFGRLFGARRAMSAPFTHRLLYLAAAPLLPVLLTVRTMRDAHRKPDYTAPFWQSFWLVSLLNLVWAWGEFLGSLTGRVERTLAHAPQGNN